MNHSYNEVNFLDTTIYTDKHTHRHFTKKLYTKPPHNKKAELSQRRPRDAPNIWVP